MCRTNMVKAVRSYVNIMHYELSKLNNIVVFKLGMKSIPLIIFIVLLYLPIFIANNSPNYFVSNILDNAYSAIGNTHIQSESKFGASYRDFWDAHRDTFVHYPAPSLLYAVLGLVSGIDVYTLRFIPLLVLPMFLTIFIICSRLIGNSGIAPLIAFALSLNWVLSFPHTWMISYHSLGYLSHMLVIYMYIRLLKLAFGRRDLVLLIAIFSLGLLSYYSSSYFSVIFSLLVFLGHLLFRYNREFRNGFVRSIFTTVFIIFLQLFWSFDYIHEVYLSKPGFISSWYVAIINTLKNAQNILHSNPTNERLFPFGSPIVRSQIESIIIIIIKFLRYSIFLYSIMLFITLMLSKNRFHNIRLFYLILTFASIGTSIFETIAYAYSTGGINLRYFYLYTSTILVVTTFRLLMQPNVEHKKILCIMGIISIVALVGGAIVNYKDIVNNEWSVKPSLANLAEYLHIYSLLDPSTEVKASFQISGELNYVEVYIRHIINKDKDIINNPFFADAFLIYSSLKQSNCLAIEEHFKDCILIFSVYDFEKSFWGDVWGYATPPLGHEALYALKQHLNVYYDSNNFIIISS